MDSDFQNIDFVMPELIMDFEGIQNSAATIELAISAFAECLQKRLNLYSVIASQVNGDWLIFSSVFSSDDSYYENLSKHPPRPRKISSEPVLSRLISGGQILISTLKSQKDYAPMFLETASSVWLPIKKGSAVISVIELGSEIIIRSDNPNDSEVTRSFALSYEELLNRISQILETKF